MSKMITQLWHRLRISEKKLHKNQQGQSLIIIVMAFIGILAFIGLGIDLAVVYTERVNVSRAADAAALAAASELPLESAAHRRALVYLQDNGYDYEQGDVRLVIDGTPEDGTPSESDAASTIWIDTAYARDTELPPSQQPNTADRIRVRVQQGVWMTFMQFVGFGHFPVEATAEAENISNVDTVIVYDKSGSMEFDTLCYGCWEPTEEDYPGGDLYPLHWSNSSVSSADHCTGWSSSSGYNCGSYQYYNSDYEVNNCDYRDRWYNDRHYTVIEGEEYSRLSADYHSWGYTPFYTFWVMQHNGRGAYYRPGSLRGAYLSHHPFRTGGASTGVSCEQNAVENGYCDYGVSGGPFPAPRADYDFHSVGDTYYIWLRGQGGSDWGSDHHVFWALDAADPPGSVNVEEDFEQGPGYDGANSWDWTWRCLGSQWLAQGTHTLNLWAGEAGFSVDRVVATTDNRSNRCAYEEYYEDQGPPGYPDSYSPNNGRTDWACATCDPRFAGRPGGQTSPVYRPDCNVGGNPDQRNDAIYDDEQPIRSALEAAKNFVSRLDPRFDQIGYVRYDSRSDIANELECLRERGVDNCTPQVITDTVMSELDSTRAGGSTNIAEGLMDGIDVLSTVGDHNGRPGAAHVIVLMTDGEANTHSGCDYACDDEDLWPDGGADKDCVVYYAQQARNNAIIIYTISLGWGADRELMTHVAETTGGFHRWAPTPDKLDAIFDELFERIFLRLVG